MALPKRQKIEKDARRFLETPFRPPNEMAKLLLKAPRAPSTSRTAAADVALIHNHAVTASNTHWLHLETFFRQTGASGFCAQLQRSARPHAVISSVRKL